MKERRLIAERKAAQQQLNQQRQHEQQPYSELQGSDLLGASPSSFVSTQKKPTAAERIGYRRPR